MKTIKQFLNENEVRDADKIGGIRHYMAFAKKYGHKSLHSDEAISDYSNHYNLKQNTKVKLKSYLSTMTNEETGDLSSTESLDEAKLGIGNSYKIPMFNAQDNTRSIKDVVVTAHNKADDMVHFKHKGKEHKLDRHTFLSRVQESLDERIKMGDTKGLTSYKSPESEFKKDDEVRIPAAYVTPYENDEKIHIAHTVAAKFSRAGDKFHHVKVDGEDVAVPKHHVFPSNLSGKNYKNEGLDEVSAKTLGSYVKKSIEDMGDQQTTLTDSPYRKERGEALRKIINRRNGQEVAVDKLVKKAHKLKKPQFNDNDSDVVKQLIRSGR